MSFAAPIWLIALLPWAALVLWLLSRRSTQHEVPFLALWRGPTDTSRTRRALHLPPLGLLFLLIALLSSILAAARPAWRSSSRIVPHPLTLLIDRGITLSAGAGTTTRYAQAIHSLQGELQTLLPPQQPVDLILIPDSTVQHATLSEWAQLALSVGPTAMRTSPLLSPLVAQRLHDSSGLLLLVSDQPLVIRDDRLIRIVPDSTPQNIGFVLASVRTHPRPQVMLRIGNQSNQQAADLRITTGQQHIDQHVDLPPRDTARDYFIDLPTPGDTVEAEILTPDDLADDNHLWLARQGSSPEFQARTPLPSTVQRILRIYQEHRPGTDAATPLVITTDPGLLPSDQPGIIVASPLANARPQPLPASLHIEDHPLTRDIDWPAVLGSASAGPSPPADYLPLVRRDDQILLAVRTTPARQVWVNFDTPEFSRTPSFVILWSNILDWTAETTPIYTCLPPTPDNGLTPGLHPAPDGSVRAISALDVHFDSSAHPDWRPQLRRLAMTEHPQVPLAPILLVIAAVCVTGAALTWPRLALTAFSTLRTV